MLEPTAYGTSDVQNAFTFECFALVGFADSAASQRCFAVVCFADLSASLSCAHWEYFDGLSMNISYVEVLSWLLSPSSSLIWFNGTPSKISYGQSLVSSSAQLIWESLLEAVGIFPSYVASLIGVRL